MDKDYYPSLDQIKHAVYDQLLQRPFMTDDFEDMDSDVFGFTALEGHQVACFDSGGEKLICLPQVLEIIKHVSIETIESTISKLGLVLIECSPIKMAILHRYRILPRGTTYCGLMSQSNAERLCKVLTVTDSTPETQTHRHIHRKLIIPTKHQHRIRVMHDCFGQQKGILFPQLYVAVDSKCIECYDCGDVFSPSCFVGHTHNTRDNDQELALCHWGFKSSNWRWYLRLADDPSRSDEEETSLKQYLDEIKSRYTNNTEDPLVISCDHQDRHTPIDSESLNTSPSLPTPPTPPSLSPLSGINRNLQPSGSIFQQCILKIYNTQLANNDDRHQILNFLVMLRQEHLMQISSLVAERQEMIKVIMKNILSKPNTATKEIPKTKNPEEETHIQLLDSVKQKLTIFKQSRCIKRTCRSPETKCIIRKQSKNDNIVQISPVTGSRTSPLNEDHQSPSNVEVSDCDSSASNSTMTAISSRDQFQDIGSD